MLRRWGRWALVACIVAIALAPLNVAAGDNDPGEESGDGFLDSSWKQMWKSIRGEKAKDMAAAKQDQIKRHVREEEASHQSIMTKAENELSSYASIFSPLTGHPKEGETNWNKPEKPISHKEKMVRKLSGYDYAVLSTHDKHLQKYDNILTFSPEEQADKLHPGVGEHPLLHVADRQSLSRREKRLRDLREAARTAAELQKVQKELQAAKAAKAAKAANVDSKAAPSAAAAPSEARPTSAAPLPPAEVEEEQNRPGHVGCGRCLRHWSPEAITCAEHHCQHKLFRDEDNADQLRLNNDLAATMARCLPPSQGREAGQEPHVLVTGLTLPWSKPFGRPVHSWVTVTPAERSAAGLGLESGVKSHAILGGRQVLSGAALRCGTLAGAQTLQEELRPLMDWQRDINHAHAVRYFRTVADNDTAARHMAAAAMKQQEAEAVGLHFAQEPRAMLDAAAAAARAKAKMRREHQEVLARRAAEEAKVKRLQDQLAAMEGKEKGASPGARGRTTGRGHGGGSAGGTGGAGGAAPGGPAAGDAADSLGDLAGMENQLTSTLQAKQALLDAVQAKSAAAQQAKGADARAARFAAEQLKADEAALGSLENDEQSTVQSAGVAQTVADRSVSKSLERMREQRLQRQHTKLQDMLARLREKLKNTRRVA